MTESQAKDRRDQVRYLLGILVIVALVSFLWGVKQLSSLHDDLSLRGDRRDICTRVLLRLVTAQEAGRRLNIPGNVETVVPYCGLYLDK